MKIYHNPQCSTSRKTLDLIRKHGVEPEIVEYLKSPPSQAELDRLLKQLDMSPEQLMRKKETLYKELEVANRKLSRKEAIKLLVENPRLIERPIVVKGQKAVLGRPPENVLALLE